jgi:hypothetical protein|tara:strand:- start:590 stop:781 length:192 start_codon:yes stop_codon:yes gene_type:complete
MKKIVEFYITTKRELKFQLEFTDFQYNDWLENQLDSDIEQLIMNYYDENSEEIEMNFKHKLIN